MVLSIRKGTLQICLYALCCLLCSFHADCSTGIRDSIEAVCLSIEGKTELTGRNDGPIVREVLATCNLKEGNPYCAATVNWAFQKVGLKTGVKSPAWSPSWFADPSKITYKRSWQKLNYKFKKAQVFGLYYSELGRVGHIGFILDETLTNYITFEGNTNAAGSREGSGFFKKIRPKKSIYIISDYINEANEKRDWRK